MDGCKFNNEQTGYKEIVLLFLVFGFVHEPCQEIRLGMMIARHLLKARMDSQPTGFSVPFFSLSIRRAAIVGPRSLNASAYCRRDLVMREFTAL